MPDRRGPTVETALKAADHRRNLERRRQPDYAPLPLTRDRISRYSTFALTEYSLPPLRSRPSTSQSQHDEFLKAGRSPFVKATFQPTQEERAALWANARRARTADARFALIVGFGGDARSTLSLPALEGLTPLPAKDLWPAHYTEENLRAHRALAERATQPELPLLHEGAAVDAQEPATTESDALMDGLFDFDGAVEEIEAIGRVSEAEVVEVKDADAVDAEQAVEDAVDEDMMEEL
ncbi:hypothetical protein CLAFUW4_11996 [Fulvia fulva]|uniref:Uncharacterized protein n=1 Tax=Passalora fulva TaxID=5499 RepID=A0A9Q8PF12_PASFU|nr:uncharacterized protein CLAFUR5_11036 [Fulvia fulva]KAK4617884.1 hypothetical protein CLAFUR4_12001 [Fulvia fulva]KAK4618673.1 hypothetical protein CLAFUR0_12012 [Fulvia fulva]UJO21288.1 hypothetical protein CLAFUR5_11036 [Fulvia fulva]WPV18410.1 hypothetical protein CLAFUW4_11996 [Fulvia fulva]WPV33489.1 hypothetical protein CLAFUW7_12003 [Fulvia fulva]